MADETRLLNELDAAIELAQQNEDRSELASLLGKKGIALYEAEEYPQAQACFDSIMEVAGCTRNDGLKVDAQGYLGLIQAKTGNLPSGIRMLNEALNLARQSGDQQRELIQLGNIGHTYLQVANLDSAIKIFSMAVELARVVGDCQAEAGYLNNLGVIYHNISQREMMVRTFEEVLRLSEAIGDQNLQINALQHLANESLAKGDGRQAIQYARRALDILRHLTSPVDSTAIKDTLIAALITEEAFQDAIQTINEEIVQARTNQYPERELILLGQLADLRFQMGDLDQSLEIYQQALDLSIRLQRKILEGRLAGRLGAIYAERGEFGLSNQYIDRACALAESEKDLYMLAEQYYLRSLNCYQMGQYQDAAELSQKSLGLFAKLGLDTQAQFARELLAEIESPAFIRGNR